MTWEGQIAVIVASLVPARNYVLDVMSQRTTILWKGGNTRNGFRLSFEQAAALPTPSLRGVGKSASGLQLQDCHEILRVNERLVFRAFVIAEQTFVSPFRKGIDSLPH